MIGLLFHSGDDGAQPVVLFGKLAAVGENGSNSFTTSG
jgi:hypothetical protein